MPTCGTDSRTLLRLRRLSGELREQGVLDAVDGVLSELLPGSAHPREDDKIVKDAVWGVITIPGMLVPLVNSPLLQRQRRIRQLGLSYLVYPSAGYGRFEHALGCCHVMQRILGAIEQRARGRVLDERTRHQLLIGALLHDIGHMPFSHASESWMEEHEDDLRIGEMSVTDVRLAVNDAVAKKLRVAEMLSLLVLLSGRLREFLEPVLRRFDSEVDPETFLVEVAAYVAGARLSNDRIAWSEVLSGPVDADRLDYMTRDSRICGVPISVDVPRLLARCTVVSVPYEKLPELRRKVLDDEGDTLQFVTDLSGSNALEEMAVSRLILYDRIYHHQKTRAAEAVLHELFAAALDAGVLSPDLLEFWRMTDESLLHRTAACDDSRVRSLAERLLFRRLPRRAVVYGHRLMSPPAVPMQGATEGESGRADELSRRLDSGVGHLLTIIDEDFKRTDRRRELQACIRERALELAKLVPPHERPDTELELVLVSPRPSSPLTSLGEALVHNPGGTVSRLVEHMPLDHWSTAFDLNKLVGYVFSDPGWETLVHVATELELWRARRAESGSATIRFRLNDASRVRAKLSQGRIDALREALDAKDVYDEARPLRPVVVNAGRLREVAERFRVFQGAGGWRVSAESLAAWLRQFPCRMQQAVVDHVLEHVEVVDRSELRDAFARQLRRILDETDRRLRVVALTPNSGTLVRQLAEGDLRNELGERVHFAHRLLRGEPVDDCVTVLVDDIIASGSQATAQLQAWLEVPRSEWKDPDEQNIDGEPLPEDQAERLRTSPLYFVFARGTESARDALRAAARDLAISAPEVRIDARLRDKLAELEATAPEVVDYLRRVGTDLLRDRKGESWAAKSALGYGGISSLTIGIFNVPTCCPPALWCPGTFESTPWTPLFIRRGYESKAQFE